MSAKEQKHNPDKASPIHRSPKPVTNTSYIQADQEQTLSAVLIQQARLDPKSLTPQGILQLQRIVGNQATVRLLVGTIQRANGDSDMEWEEESGDEDYITSLADHEDGELHDPYYRRIRRYFYPNGYWVATMNWMDDELDDLEDPHNAANFICPECGLSKPKNQATIDHIRPVSQHWNEEGFDQTQAQRINWYNDTNNHQVMCGPCNSGLGGMAYRTDIGYNFLGPDNLEG